MSRGYHQLSSDGVSPLAILSTASGIMHVYTFDAGKAWPEMVRQLNAVSPSSASPTNVNIADPRLERTAVVKNDGVSPCIDGWSLELWAQYAKRKSHIVSRMCRLNGELKPKLAAFTQGLAKDSPNGGMRPDDEDIHKHIEGAKVRDISAFASS